MKNADDYIRALEDEGAIVFHLPLPWDTNKAIGTAGAAPPVIGLRAGMNAQDELAAARESHQWFVWYRGGGIDLNQIEFFGQSRDQRQKLKAKIRRDWLLHVVPIPELVRFHQEGLAVAEMAEQLRVEPKEVADAIELYKKGPLKAWYPGEAV